MKKEDILIGFLVFITIVFLTGSIYYYFAEIKPTPEPASEVVDNNEEDKWDYTTTITDPEGNNYTIRASAESYKYELLNAQELVLLSSTLGEDKAQNILAKGLVLNIYTIPSNDPDFSYLAIDNESLNQYEIIGISNNNVTNIVDIGSSLIGEYSSANAGDEFKNYIIEDSSITFYYGNGCVPEFEAKLSDDADVYYLKMVFSANEYSIEKLVSPYDDVQQVAGEKC